MRKSQKCNRQASKIIDNQIMKFYNASLSDKQRKDIVNKATNYGTNKTNNNTIYQLIKDTLIEDKPFRNIAPLGKQIEKASIESGYHTKKGKWISTFRICSNLEKVQSEGLGIENQTNEERMTIKNELKYYKNTIDNFDRSKINQIK